MHRTYSDAFTANLLPGFTSWLPPSVSGHRLCQVDFGDRENGDEQGKMKIIFLTHSSDQATVSGGTYFPYLRDHGMERSATPSGSCLNGS